MSTAPSDSTRLVTGPSTDPEDSQTKDFPWGKGPGRRQDPPMAVDGERVRFLVELVRTGDEPVTGSVSTAGREVCFPFCGWLELLALLEGLADGRERQWRAGDARSE